MTSENTASNADIEAVIARQRDDVLAQQTALAVDEDMRSLVRDISVMRFGEPAADYSTFKELQLTMREVFNFRKTEDGKTEERAAAADFECDDEMSGRIFTMADRLGLRGDTIPENPDAKLAVILGGSGRAPLDRTMYTKELMDTGKLRVGMVALLGSEAPIDDAARERGGDYAKDAQTEFELMIAAAEAVFGAKLDQSDIYEGTDPSLASNAQHGYKVAHIEATETHPDIFILSSSVLTNPFAARNGKKEVRRKRSNTADTLNMLAKVADLEPGDRAVVVSNAHFKFQGVDAAAQLASLGAETELAGFDPSHYGAAPKTPTELLQEMLSLANSLAKATA